MADQGRGTGRGARRADRPPGIVIADGRREPAARLRPRISAFIWGGKVRPAPTLPFGRWKGAA